MNINENSMIYKRFANKSKMFDEGVEKTNKKINKLNELIEKRNAETESSNLKDHDETSKNEKKEVFNKLKTKENIMPQPTPEKVEKVVDDTSQATAIPDSYRVLFGGDKR